MEFNYDDGLYDHRSSVPSWITFRFFASLRQNSRTRWPWPKFEQSLAWVELRAKRGGSFPSYLIVRLTPLSDRCAVVCGSFEVPIQLYAHQCIHSNIYLVKVCYRCYTTDVYIDKSTLNVVNSPCEFLRPISERLQHHWCVRLTICFNFDV